MTPVFNVLNKFIIVAFLTFIWLPLLLLIVSTPGDITAGSENRNLNPLPAAPLSIKTIRRFPEEFELYFDDHFGLRQWFVTTYNRFNYHILKRSEEVIIGEQGWLFYAGEDNVDGINIDIIRDYCGQLPLDDTRLASWEAMFVRREKLLTKVGIKYYLFIIPDKRTVYSQFLPQKLRCKAEQTRREQLVNHLQVNGVPVFDLTDVLQQSRANNKLIYRKTDTHWNSLGAFSAYQEIMRHLKQEFPQVNSVTENEFTITPVNGRGGDLARLLGLDDDLHEIWLPLQVREPKSKKISLDSSIYPDVFSQKSEGFEHNSKKLPAIFVHHDSFTAGPLKQLLAESFSRSVFMWGDLKMNIERLPFKIEKPDVFVDIFVERKLLRSAPEAQVPDK